MGKLEIEVEGECDFFDHDINKKSLWGVKFRDMIIKIVTKNKRP